MPKTTSGQRVAAVLALLAGKSWSSTIADFGISRGRLAELRLRALESITAAVADRRPGARVAPNRTAPAAEAAVVAAARRYPMEPARSITERTAVPTRTVQRIRRRWNLSKLTRRAPARYRRHRIDPRAPALLATARQQRPSLGPSRLAWDVRNQDGVNVSPSWVRDQMHGRYQRRGRGATPRPVWRRYERAHAHSLWHGDFLEKVYLGDGTRGFQFSLIDDHSRTVVFSGIFIEKTAEIALHGLTEAILDHDVVPTAVLFDNESVFRAKVGEFCGRVPDVNYISPLATITSPHRAPRLSGRGSWSWSG